MCMWYFSRNLIILIQMFYLRLKEIVERMIVIHLWKFIVDSM